MKTFLTIGATVATVVLSLGGAASLCAQAPEPAASPAQAVVRPAATAAPSPKATATPEATAGSVDKKVLDKYDTDKDGVLSPAEKDAYEKDRAARKAERLRKYDKNGDGKLDDSERAAMLKDKEAQQIKEQEKAPAKP